MNYVENVAKMLGVEMYEHFYLTDYNGKRLKGKYELTDHGLVCFRKSDVFEESYAEIFHRMIVGTYKVKKIQFHPKVGETYYSYNINSNESTSHIWKNSCADRGRFMRGNVFKSAKEAIAMADKYIKSLETYELAEECVAN